PRSSGRSRHTFLLHRQLLALPQVAAGQGERGRWGKFLWGFQLIWISPVLDLGESSSISVPSGVTLPCLSEQLADAGSYPADCCGVDRAVDDLLADLLADGSGDDLGGASGVVHAPSGAVAGESVGDVEALFEVVAERE